MEQEMNRLWVLRKLKAKLAMLEIGTTVGKFIYYMMMNWSFTFNVLANDHRLLRSILTGPGKKAVWRILERVEPEYHIIPSDFCKLHRILMANEVQIRVMVAHKL